MTPTDKANESRFWDQYVEVVKSVAVPEKARRWYVVRVERYIEAHPDRPLHSHISDDVTRYLTEAGRDASMQGWLFRQLVHALQLLFARLIRADWAQDFDWQFWSASAQELEHSHPTIARHNSLITNVVPPPPNGTALSASQ